MSAPARVVALVAAVALGSSACSRADLYAITASTGADGGSGDAGSNDGGAGEGGVEPGTCDVVAEPSDATHTVLVGGVSRSYVLHVPEAYDGATAVPLVVDFHGIGSTGAEQLESSPYPELLDAEGVVMAFPEGLRGPAGTAWNVGPCCVEDADDLAFARALVADVRRRACIDPKRVYAAGVLTGGGMAHYVGCHAADLFAAIAPAAFDLLEENVDDCAPSRGIGVISFRGTEDGRVPYEGGPSSVVPGMPVTFLGAQGTLEAWARINECSTGPSPEDARGCASYTGCRDGVEVVLCTEQGGTEEPGDPAIAWPFLSRYTL